MAEVMIGCDVEDFGLREGWDQVLPEYRMACIGTASYFVWHEECLPWCAGHPLCEPCARLSQQAGNVSAIESLESAR